MEQTKITTLTDLLEVKVPYQHILTKEILYINIYDLYIKRPCDINMYQIIEETLAIKVLYGTKE